MLRVDQEPQQPDDTLPFCLGKASGCGIVDHDEVCSEFSGQDDSFSLATAHASA
jgi:hypothetical protein